MFKLLRVSSRVQGRVAFRVSSSTSSARRLVALRQFSQCLPRTAEATSVSSESDAGKFVDQAPGNSSKGGVNNANSTAHAGRRSLTLTLRIMNLRPDVTETEVRTAFEKFGTVANVVLPVSDTGASLGVGWVKFATLEDAIKCRNSFLEVPTDIGEYAAVRYLGPAKCYRLFFHGFSESKTSLQNMVDEWAPDNQGITFFRRRKDESESGWIHFKRADAAAKGLRSLSGAKTPAGYRLEIHFDDSETVRSSTLSVFDLPPTTTEDEFRNAFMKFGQLAKVILPLRADGRCLGFGYVLFSDLEDAVTCYEACVFQPMAFSGYKASMRYCSVPDWSILKFWTSNGGKEEVTKMLEKRKGDIKEIVFEDSTGHKGFIRFKSAEAAEAAIDTLTNLPRELHASERHRDLNLRFSGLSPRGKPVTSAPAKSSGFSEDTSPHTTSPSRPTSSSINAALKSNHPSPLPSRRMSATEKAIRQPGISEDDRLVLLDILQKDTAAVQMYSVIYDKASIDVCRRWVKHKVEQARTARR